MTITKIKASKTTQLDPIKAHSKTTARNFIVSKLRNSPKSFPDIKCSNPFIFWPHVCIIRQRHCIANYAYTTNKHTYIATQNIDPQSESDKALHLRPQTTRHYCIHTHTYNGCTEWMLGYGRCIRRRLNCGLFVGECTGIPRKLCGKASSPHI